jgi:hypothetical protein
MVAAMRNSTRVNAEMAGMVWASENDAMPSAMIAAIAKGRS